MFCYSILTKKKISFSNILSSIKFGYFNVSRKDVLLLKKIRIYITENYLLFRYKNRLKYNQHFELLFFLRALHFATSNYLHVENKITSHKEYSLGLLFSGNPKNTLSDQISVQVFWVYPQTNNSQTMKSSSCKIKCSLICILLVQHASINVFYSIWRLECIVFLVFLMFLVTLMFC